MTTDSIFPYKGVLQPALTLAYLSTYSVPAAFIILPSEIAGVLVGLSTIICALVGFRDRHIRLTEVSNASLVKPLLGSSREHVHRHYNLLPGLYVFVIFFSFLNSVCEKDLTSSLILGLNIFAVSPEMRNIRSSGIIICSVILLVSGFRGMNLWNPVEGYVLAVLSGVLFHSISTLSLPVWDWAHHSKMGFTLSAAAILALFVGVSTLELVTS